MMKASEQSLEDRQIAREETQRQIALGRRVSAIQKGRLGPVLKRWVNADVLPIAALMRSVAKAYIEGDMEKVAFHLDAPTAELSQREKPLLPLMHWILRGASPGRDVEGVISEQETTHAEDLALAFMGAVIPRLAADKTGAHGTSLTAALTYAADILRDTVSGQFITHVQGAKAMQAVRETRPELWQQRKSLARISLQLQSQVKPQAKRRGGGESLKNMGSGKRVYEVTDYKGRPRRLELKRTPDDTDWHVLALCWQDEADGGSGQHRQLWMAFALMFLHVAWKVGGWFIVSDKVTYSASRRKRKTKMINLSPAALEAIARDVERWVSCGFAPEPMIVPPVDGDYLTVKHRKVTGQRPPKGMITNPQGTFAWERGALPLAETPWQVNTDWLQSDTVKEIAAEGDMADRLRIEHHKRVASEEAIYLPVNMDFRGRMYYRTPWVTPQSGDLGKSLLMFPPTEHPHRTDFDVIENHLATLDSDGKPHTAAAHGMLVRKGEGDCIPIQLDGTCNGLQHLSALMRDEQGAEAVNLMEGSEEGAEDIYKRVALAASNGVLHLNQQYHDVNKADHVWASRFLKAGGFIDRSVCKGPVMVLPYGGTREAIRKAVKEAVLKQLAVPTASPCESPWHSYTADGYEVFQNRPLHDHPLFNSDITKLAAVIHGQIAPQIPKAMETMTTLQEIGKWVGERGLSWRTGPYGSTGLWVTQAKSKAQRKQLKLKGFHLPDTVRRLTLITNSDEVDPKAHRTGIVANFIHSLDSAHLARAICYFKRAGGSCVGAIHDCVMVRPSEVELMNKALRASFVDMYKEDPLLNPVHLFSGVDGGESADYRNWHELAKAAGCEFPDRGSFDIENVLQSKWFFS